MPLIKIFFNKIIYNDQISIYYNGGRGGGKSLVAFYFFCMFKFKKEHSILCKIPIINWFLFKRYLNKIFRKVV